MNKEENIWKPKFLGIFSEEERNQIEKREIEEGKKCLNETIQNTYAEGKAIKLENLKNYIEQLEFENKALKAEHNHNITRIKKLEQKESILDKVTDKLKKMKQSINKLKNRDGETMIMVDVCIQNIIAFYNDIEKIIEGEKK